MEHKLMNMKQLLKNIVVTILAVEAKWVLRRYKPKIVAVTGSVGKTSTKDAIYAVMSAKFYVRKSEKSFNSEIGIPLTVLGLPNAWGNPLQWVVNIVLGLKAAFLADRYPEWLVLEVGADHPGDIERITRWLKPDIAVVTKIPDVPVHVEHFLSPKEVVGEKSRLVRALKREGTLVLNHDDVNAMSFREFAPDNELITYGFDSSASIIASEDLIAYDVENGRNVPRGTNFRVDMDGRSVLVHLYGSLGRQHIYPCLAAISVGSVLGLNLVDMAESLGRHRPPRARMKIIPGVKGTTLIDDTYNSSPVALERGLETLKNIETEGRKFAVLGDMLELGRYSIEEHKEAGRHVAEAADILIAVGVRMRDLADEAVKGGMSAENVFVFDDSREAGKKLETLLQAGDVALIKGSQGIRMERAVLEAMAHPENADKLLVRQEEEWKNR